MSLLAMILERELTPSRERLDVLELRLVARRERLKVKAARFQIEDLKR